jgi:hypothetical protein
MHNEVFQSWRLIPFPNQPQTPLAGLGILSAKMIEWVVIRNQPPYHFRAAGASYLDWFFSPFHTNL